MVASERLAQAVVAALEGCLAAAEAEPLVQEGAPVAAARVVAAPAEVAVRVVAMVVRVAVAQVAEVAPSLGCPLTRPA